VSVDDVLIAGRYRLESEVGRGGMGVVWQAYDELLHRRVAVKEVRFPADLPAADRERLAGRTLREARAVAAVETHAAVRVFDIVEQDGRPWIVMELVRGGTLTDLLHQRTALPTDEVAHIGLAVLEALEAAHAAGVLHRDVKPSNILMGVDGRIALTDFGIATVDGDSDAGQTTTSGAVVGSPAYIAPERAHGHRPTAASDLWSLGATLWTAVEGRPPYDGPTAYAVMAAVTTADPPVCERCTPALSTLLRELMDREPALRPTAAKTRAALTAILNSDVGPSAAPDPQPTARLPIAFDRTTVLGGSEAVVPEPEPEPEPELEAEPEPEPELEAEPEPELEAEPEPPAGASGNRRRGRLLLASAALAVAAAGVVAAIVLTGGSSANKHSAGAGHPHRRSHPTATAPSAATASVPSAALPAGWTRYTDPALGWTVGVPPGWTRSTSSAGTTFSDPAGGRYVLVATRYPAGSSAVGAWRDSERSFRASHSDYQRIALHTVTVPGAKDAADWEFTYVDGGAALHALDHAVVIGNRGYAVYLQSHSNRWAASQELFDQVQQSFRPEASGA
jgi:serine/threonine protein kinase